MSKVRTRLFELIVDGDRQFHALPGAAAPMWDSGFSRVEQGTWIIEEGIPRKWTAQDRSDLQEAADDYSASK